MDKRTGKDDDDSPGRAPVSKYFTMTTNSKRTIPGKDDDHLAAQVEDEQQQHAQQLSGTLHTHQQHQQQL